MKLVITYDGPTGVTSLSDLDKQARNMEIPSAPNIGLVKPDIHKLSRKPILNRTNIANINPIRGGDPGQKFQVVQANETPKIAREHAQANNANNPIGARQAYRANFKRVTGRFYRYCNHLLIYIRKLNLTERWEQKEKHHLASTPPVIDPISGNLMTIHQLQETLQGHHLQLALDYQTMRAAMRVIMQVHNVLEVHYSNSFYLKERMIRSTAQRRALRVVGLYLVDRIEV